MIRSRLRRPLHTIGAAFAVWLIVGRIHLARLLDRLRYGRRRSADAGIEGRIRRELLSWPGVTVAPHRYGGIEFRLGKRELGHLHGDYLADLPFPIRLREGLVAQGRAMPHHILPGCGMEQAKVPASPIHQSSRRC